MLLRPPWLFNHHKPSFFNRLPSPPLSSNSYRVSAEVNTNSKKKMGAPSFTYTRSEEEEEEEGVQRPVSSSMGVVLPALDTHAHCAASALREGHVIAIPTDTLYGFAADACSAQAVEKIYAIKGRNSKVPLAVCLAHPEDFEKYSVTSYLPEGLLQALFPGPVTTVLQRGEHSLLNKGLNPGLCSIGIRIPDSFFIRKVVELFGGAIALTSANISGQLSTIHIDEFSALWPHCAFVFDGGELPPTREGSTVVDLTIPGTFKVLRSGRGLESTLTILGKYGLSARE